MKYIETTTGDKYQVCEPLTESEYAELKASIAEHGVLVPVDVDEQGTILDGHHRVRAWEELRAEGVEVPRYARLIRQGLSEEEKFDHAVRLNDIRRHMTPEARVRTRQRAIEQRERARLQVLELRQQGKSIRQIVDETGLGHGTVQRAIAGVPDSDSGTPAFVNGADGKSYPAQQAHTLPVEIPVESTAEKNRLTLTEWKALDIVQQLEALAAIAGHGRFNKQEGDSIEWARWSWNPLTGCLHNCPYCYARDIANFRFPQGFEPTVYPNRLSMPANTPMPDLSKFDNEVDRMGWRNVFTCSMSDLFGLWNPKSWIDAVLDQIRANRQWNFLLLTKFPDRMAEFEFPPNTWIGTTVDKQWAVERAEKAFRKIRAGGYKGVAWLSCEPMLECLTFSSLDMFDWVVMGGASKSSQTPAFAPLQRWISHLVAQADACNLPIYQKTNLVQEVRNGVLVEVDFEGRLREYPVAQEAIA